MLTITRAEFNKAKEHGHAAKNIIDYTHNGKTYPAGTIYTILGGCIKGHEQLGTTLLFQHVHFEIV